MSPGVDNEGYHVDVNGKINGLNASFDGHDETEDVVIVGAGPAGFMLG